MIHDDDAIQAARRLVAEALAKPLDDIPPDGSIHTVPAWDSLGHVRVLLALEATIGRSLSSAEIATVTSVTDVTSVLIDIAAPSPGPEAPA